MLQSLESQRVRCDLATEQQQIAAMHSHVTDLGSKM